MNEYRFVILEHNWNGIHYDLMLEENGVLKTWRLAELLRTGTQIGEKLPDHRIDYLQYEGPVSGNRGTVKRVASGIYFAEESPGNKNVSFLSGGITGRLEIVEQDKATQLLWTPTN